MKTKHTREEHNEPVNQHGELLEALVAISKWTAEREIEIDHQIIADEISWVGNVVCQAIARATGED